MQAAGRQKRLLAKRSISERSWQRKVLPSPSPKSVFPTIIESHSHCKLSETVGADSCRHMHLEQMEGVHGHGLWHLSCNKVRLRKTGTQGGGRRIKKLLSDHGEYKQKDTKSPLRPLNLLQTAGELGVRNHREGRG